MLGFLKKLFGGGEERDWSGDIDCYEALIEEERICPKCGSRKVHFSGTLGEELSRYERPYDIEKDQWIEYDVTYSIFCRCRCLDCGHQWEKRSQVTKYERDINPYFQSKIEGETEKQYEEEQRVSEEEIMQEETQIEEEDIESMEEELAECGEEILEDEE